jgi:hypothetical protein
MAVNFFRFATCISVNLGFFEFYYYGVFLVVDGALADTPPDCINVNDTFQTVICDRFSATQNIPFSNGQQFLLFVENC